MNPATYHPAQSWEEDARHPQRSLKTRLRLGAMAGHMRVDKIAARRAALIDLLGDGRSHPREEIWETVSARLGEDCWGKLPHEALARDLKALRRGGLRIAYARRPAITGYYLQHPPLRQPERPQYEAVNWQLVSQLRTLSVPQKNERAFAAAAFALRQKRLLLAEAHPEWEPHQVEAAARQQVFGVTRPHTASEE